MTTFRYKGISTEGAKVSGIINAYDEFEAVSQLRETCSVVTAIEPVKESKAALTPGKIHIKDKELAIICSQLSIVITSGLPVVRCVEMVASQAKNKNVQHMLQKSAEDIAGGYSMAQSFEKNGKGLPATFIETVRAGEQSGTLENCFKRLHKYYDKTAKTKAKVISTLTYPAIVLVVAIIVFIILMVVAVPLFTRAFQELGTDLPAITKALIGFSDFLTSYWWAFIALGAIIWVARLLINRTTKGKLFLATKNLTISPFWRLNVMNASGQFANTMATMLTAGIPITKALEVTSNVISNYAYSEAVRKVMMGVEQGKRIADCMNENSLFPKMLTEMTAVGERAGSMEDTLTVVGDYYDNEVEIITSRLLSLLEPIITIALAVIAVILLMAVYLPMFSMYGSI